MHFKRYGKTYQLIIETPDDLHALLELDEAHWVATSVPVEAFTADVALGPALDRDGDGRVNTTDVRRELRWLLERLAEASVLFANQTEIPLSSLRADSAEGKGLLRSARHLRAATAVTEAVETVSLEAVRAFLARIESQPLNGDGVLVPAAAEDRADLRGLIEVLIRTTGGTPDRSGQTGVSDTNLDAFLNAAAAHLAWLEKAMPAHECYADSMPFGEDTPSLHALVTEHAAEVELFFASVNANRFMTGPVTGVPAAPAAAVERSAAGILDRLRAEPIAHPTSSGELPLDGPLVNPFFRDWLASLRDTALPRLLGQVPAVLTESQWHAVRDALKSYHAYRQTKPSLVLDDISVERLREYVDDPTLGDALRSLIDADRRMTTVIGHLRELERLLLYIRYMVRVVNNFASIPDLYHPDRRAMIECGSAVIDGRWFNLAVRVDNRDQHAAHARHSNMFVMYLEVQRPNAPYVVAIPATAGARGNLAIGKRGIFFDLNGHQHAGRIIHVIENPISIREAMGAPFVRLWEFIVGKFEAMSTLSEKQLQSTTDNMMTHDNDGQSPPSSATPGNETPASTRTGMLVGLSLSAAAIGSSFAFVTRTFTGMTRAQGFASLLGAVLMVMVPVCLIAYVKLKRQDLSSLIEGCGWAINPRMRLTREQRRLFTRRPGYPLRPAPATRTRRRIRMLLLVLALLLACVALGRGFVD